MSHNRIGDVLRDQGNLPGALESYRASLAIAERLAKADPGNADWQRDLSVSHNGIGDVLRAQGNLPGALESYRASLAIRERLAKADPGNADWQRDLSVSHDRIGDVLRAQGNLPGALESYRASLAISRASGEGRPRQCRLAARPLGVARQDRRRAAGSGQPAWGAGELPRLARHRERLAKADPDNAGWQHDLALSLQRVGYIAARQGEPDAARTAYERGHEIMLRLVGLAPDNTAFKRDLAWFEARLAELKQ